MISKDISQEAFQLELPEEWMVHNVLNKDLLTRCREPQFKRQYMGQVPTPDIINKEEEYKAEEIRSYRKQGCNMQFLVYQKGYGNKHNQWISETELPYARKARVLSQNL